MADKIIALMDNPFRRNCRPVDQPICTDPIILAYLDELTNSTLLAAQRRNITRQNRLAQAIEFAAHNTTSETERTALQNMWKEVMAKSVVADDTLVDILSNAVVQGGGIGRF